MNQIAPTPGFRDSSVALWLEPPTEVQRHRFDRHTLLKLWEQDLLGERRVELIDGVVFDMPPEGPYHQTLREELTQELVIALRDLSRRDLRVSSNGPLRLGDYDEPEPDIYVSDRAKPIGQVGGPETTLAIEVTVTTHRHDFGRKQALYARFDVRELWIIDGRARVTFVHRGPQRDGSWREVTRYEADQEITPEGIPGFRFRLVDILPTDAENA